MRKPNHDGVLAAVSHIDAPGMYLTGMYLIYTGDNPMQTQVQEFMTAIGQKSGDVPGFYDSILHRRLILQKHRKWEDSLDDGDFPGAIDALADMMYVILATFEAFGVDAQTVFNVVHAANMRKLTGPKNEHSKQLKPEGWKPPDIAGILHAAGWKDNKETI